MRLLTISYYFPLISKLDLLFYLATSLFYGHYGYFYKFFSPKIDFKNTAYFSTNTVRDYSL